MLLAKWREEHNSEWMHKCEVCEDVEELRALINQFSSDGVDWALASQLFKVEKGQTGPNSSGMSGCKPVPKSFLKAIKSEAVTVNTQSRDSAVAKPVVVSREMPKEEKHAALMSPSKSMGKARANEKQQDRGERQKGEGPASSAPAANAGRAAGASEKAVATEHDIPQQKNTRTYLCFWLVEAQDTGHFCITYALLVHYLGVMDVKRGWRYRKGRWMYVILKDDESGAGGGGGGSNTAAPKKSSSSSSKRGESLSFVDSFCRANYEQNMIFHIPNVVCRYIFAYCRMH